ncbi:hypothetical protein BJ993_000878 [Nocardioides aromaticivorans]|uniref:IrrE N-terminal-like domain-containing protein n=1 Tax=Nocardioides aromaticivorans TaxID=200618 RepID=A0A7Z0CM94_9ACTN|nr:ImmA/IrrE family metallo-endopeptidase [Nocardioides aromaticivorans]NYI43798.1 hypothetical protein [Nocardioides aromaticivorans]
MPTSQLELARDLCPGVPDAVLVESLVEVLGQKLDLEPPIDLHRVASFQGVKDIQVAEMDWAGMLAPSESGGFIIKVRSADRPHRRNFTIGHEITHTLLPGYAVIQHRCGGLGTRSLHGNRHLENLADIGAAELLLPRRFLQPIFADLAFDMSAVKDVADRHHASLDATLRRLLHLTSRHAIVVDLRQSVLPDGRTLTTIHRVFSNSEWCPIAPLQLHGKRVPPMHPINEVLGCAEAADVVDLSFLHTATPTAHISAISDPYIDNEGRTVMRSLVLATPRQTQSVHAPGHGRLPAAS